MSSTFVRIGQYILDVSLNEDHKFESEVTEFPVESGGAISDNIRPKPITVSITGIITDTPLTSNAINQLQQLEDPYKENATVDAISGGSLSPTSTMQLIGNLAAPSLAAPVAIKFLRSEQAYLYLRSIYESRNPVTIRTSLGTFNNMALESLSVPRSKETTGGLTFTADFKQIKQVTNQRIRTATRNSKKKRNRGPQPTLSSGQYEQTVLWRQANPPGSSLIYNTVQVKYIQSNKGSEIAASIRHTGGAGGWFFWESERGLKNGRNPEDVTRATGAIGPGPTYAPIFETKRGARLNAKELRDFEKDYLRDKKDREHLGNYLVDQGYTRNQGAGPAGVAGTPYLSKNVRDDMGNLSRKDTHPQSNLTERPGYQSKGNFEDTSAKPKGPGPLEQLHNNWKKK